MKQSTLNTILCCTILALAIIIAYRYSQTSSIEHFEEQQQINGTETTTSTNNTVSPEPESTYNLQQYIETNPPTGSKVIKKEIKHNLPDLVDKDITMAENKHIRFGTMRGEVGTNKDTFFFQSESDQVTPKLKLIMEDKKNKNPTFQIHGGACDAQGNCSLDGPALYKFDSQPNFKITGKNGDALHELKPNGDAWHKGNISAKDVRIRGNLHVDGKVNGQDDGFKQGGEESQNHFVHGTSNAKDVNVRGRIYFSQAQKGQVINPHDRNFYNSSNYKNRSDGKWSGHDPFYTIHDSDPYYIEKVVSGHQNSRLRITVNDDANEGVEIYSHSCNPSLPKINRNYANARFRNANNCRTHPGHKVFDVNGEGNQWNKGNVEAAHVGARNTVNANDVNVRGRIYFSQTPMGSDPRGYLYGSSRDHRAQLDNWHHTDPFYIEKKRNGARNVLRITINDDHNDAVEIWGGSCRRSSGNWCRNEGNLLFRVDGEGTVWGKRFKTF